MSRWTRRSCAHSARALDASGETVRIEGMTAWTDAALLNAAGIPAICFGPGDISLAHAAEEWVSVSEIERATKVLARLVTEWFGGTADLEEIHGAVDARAVRRAGARGREGMRVAIYRSGRRESVFVPLALRAPGRAGSRSRRGIRPRAST